MTTNRHAGLIGVAAILCAAVLWGTTGTIQALLPEGREPMVVAAMRVLIGALTLLAFAAASGAGRAAFSRLPWTVVGVAGVAIGLYNALFFAAVSNVGVGIGTALAIGSAPLWVTVFDLLILRRLPGARRLLGQAVCIAGATLLAVSGAAAQASPAGVLLALAAGAAYATYSLVTSRIGAAAPATTIAAGTFAIAAVCLMPALVLLPADWIDGAAVWARLLFLGAVVTGVSYALYTWGLKQVAPSAAVTLALAEPLTAWLLATFVVGEALTVAKVIGAVVLLLGLWIVTSTIGNPTAGRAPGASG